MKAPDGSDLTPEEWEAVRRLRGRRDDGGRHDDEKVTPDEAVTPGDAVMAEEPAAALPSTPRTPSATPLLVPAIVALTVLAVVAVTLLAVVTARLSTRHGQRSDATAAMAAAGSGVAAVLSYNYKSLDADFAKAEAALTPSFRKKYDATTAKAVQPLAAKYHAVSTAQVTAAGVMSASGSHVQVLVFVSQQVTNTQLSAPRLDRSRIIVDLQKSGTRWLINNLNPV